MKKILITALFILVASTAFAGRYFYDNFSQALASGALSTTKTYSYDTRVRQVMVHASTAISETITVTFDSADGSNYDTLLASTTLSSATDYVFRPAGILILRKGDGIKVTCTNNGGTGTVYGTVQVEGLE